MKNVIVGKDDNRKTLLEAIEEHNKQMEDLIGKEFVYGTLQRYRTTLSHTKSFIKWKYDLDDIDLRDLNYEFASDSG